MPKIIIKPYEDLSRDELYEILQLRVLVFVVGQKITDEPEIDGRDPECEHVLMRNEQGVLVGTARIFARQHPMSVGRVAVHPDFQGLGLGTELMKGVQARLGNAAAELHAQAHLQGWYTSLGWTPHGDIFDEAGIPHIHMLLGRRS